MLSTPCHQGKLFIENFQKTESGDQPLAFSQPGYIRITIIYYSDFDLGLDSRFVLEEK